MQKRESSHKGIFRCFAAGLLAFLLCGVLTASAADLGFSPASGTFVAGKSFTVNIRIKNNKTAINAVSGEVDFPKDLLSVSSMSKAGSIVKLWAEEPHYSNDAGTLNFEGVILNPGFSGTDGTVLSVTFLAKKTGTAALSYSSGEVLANDGMGTSVIGALESASFGIAKTLNDFSAPATTPSAAPQTPAGQGIASSTHPDSSKWYSAKDAVFSWTLPSDVTAVRLLVDSNPTSVPTRVYEPPISSKTVADNADGIHYFHLQFRNAKGWGDVSHFRFQIDTVPPEPFTITFPHGKTSDNPQSIIYFNTPDKLSGISNYEIKVGEGDLLKVAPDALSNPYVLPPQSAGDHTVIVRAIDAAGNSTTESADFSVSSIAPPQFTRFPADIAEEDLLKIRGVTYADASVDLFMTDDGGRVSTEFSKSNSLGDFATAWSQKLAPGVYKLTAQVTDNRGAKSALTDPVTITISEKPLVKIGSLVVTYFMLSIAVILAIAFLAFLIWYLNHRFALLRRRISKGVIVSETAMHFAFNDLKKEVRKHVRILQKTKAKRTLTDEENNLIETLEKKIFQIEKELDEKLAPFK